MDRRIIFLILVVIIVGVAIFALKKREEPSGPEPTPPPQIPVSVSPAPIPLPVSAVPAVTPTPVPVTPTAVPREKAQKLLEQAETLLQVGEKEEAWRTYSRVLENLEAEQAARVKKTITQLADQILFSKEPSSFSETYVVKPGDQLYTIAKPYKIPHELVMKINGLKSDLIHPGDRLKVVRGPFGVTIDTSKLILTVYYYGRFVKEYPVGLGEKGLLAEGEYPVRTKLINPAWTHPDSPMAAGDPNNPLGERWIGFYGEYGIHGTIEPESIGKRVSLGCVRMHEKDVEEVFDLVVREYSTVTIKDGI
jgi:LysM repeat protein